MNGSVAEPFEPYVLNVDDDRDWLRVSGRETDTLHVLFTSWQQVWPQPLPPLGYDFLNTAIRYNLSAICIRDPTNRWFHGGVRGLGESILGVRDALARETEHFEHVVTLGSSMGGYGALLFGALLRADVAVGIVPQIHVGTAAALEISDSRFADDYAAIDEISRTREYCRLEAVVGSGTTRSVVITGDRDRDDSANVSLLRGLPDVEALALPDTDHSGAARTCLTTQILSQFLDGSYLGGAPLNAELAHYPPPQGREIA